MVEDLDTTFNESLTALQDLQSKDLSHFKEIYTDTFPFYRCNYISITTLVKYNIERNLRLKCYYLT